MANKKLDFSGPFLNGEGEPFKIPVPGATDGAEKVLTLGSGLADMLFKMKSAEPEKPFYWGLELKKTGVLSLDKVDLEYLKKYIKEHETLPVLEKGRLLEVFENAK